MTPGRLADEPTTPSTLMPTTFVRLGTVGPAGRLAPMTPALLAVAVTPTPVPAVAWARIAAAPISVTASTPMALCEYAETPTDESDLPVTPLPWSDTPTIPSTSCATPITPATFGTNGYCSSVGLSPRWPITPDCVDEMPKTPCWLLDVPTTPA